MHESPERARRFGRGSATPLFEHPAARRTRFAVIVVGAVLAVAAVGWVIVTGLLARSQLNQVRAELPRLRSALSQGDVASAQAVSAAIDKHAGRAHALTTGPAWWLGSSIPVLGDPLATARVISQQTSRIGTSVLPGLVTLAGDLSTGKLQTADGVDLAPLIAAEPTLDRAAAIANSADEAMRSTSKSWLGSIETARQDMTTNVAKLHDEIAGASRAIQTAVPMLGAGGTRRYFIAFENEAESRGLGGVPGSFAIVEVHGGQVSFSHYGSDLELLKTHVSLDLGADFAARYKAANPAYSYPNSDISPDFTYAARIWAAMWQQQSGQHIDGAAVIDPTALSALLRVTGPAYLPDGREINASNVVQISEQTQYSMFRHDDAANSHRRAFLTLMAKAITEKFIHGGDAKALVRALAKQAAQHRFALWSEDPTLEANIAAGGFGGLLPAADGRPVTGFVAVNATGGKLDYYLDRTMTYDRTGCTGTSSSLATFTVTNTAPASGLPPYVTQRRDHAPAGVKPGDDRVLVTYYAGHGATITSMKVDGKAVTFVSDSEKGLATAEVDLELPRGTSRSVSVAVAEQPAVSDVEVIDQPLARPMTVTLSGSRCGG